MDAEAVGEQVSFLVPAVMLSAAKQLAIKRPSLILHMATEKGTRYVLEFANLYQGQLPDDADRAVRKYEL
jgi:hypothetical protein